MKFLCSLSLLFFSIIGFSQSAIGVWKSVDDRTGDAQSHIEIYEQDGQLFGKIKKLLTSAPETLCDKCPGDKKDTPLVGLVIIEKVKPYKDYWRKGKIMDPEDGSIYGCELWLEEGNLKVKGKHWTGLFRTQTWYRVE